MVKLASKCSEQKILLQKLIYPIVTDTLVSHELMDHFCLLSLGFQTNSLTAAVTLS